MAKQQPILSAGELIDAKVIQETKELEQALRELTDAEKELTIATKELNAVTNKSSKAGIEAQEKATKATKKLNTATNKRLSINKKLNASIAARTKLQQQETNALGAITKKWNKLQRSLTQVFIAYQTILQVMNAFKKIKDTILIIDSFNQLMLKVTGSTYEAADSLDYLIEISKDYGISLESAIQRYSKFFAAAKQANLTTEETRKIFSSMSKTAGILGLRAEEVTGVFLALEQMLSKGKVTTEELRRQLGERLPGAFGIMARAVGVSTVELDKMLKKGEIISRDVLPIFAEEMEKAFGIESVERIDTLVAAVERADTAYIDLIRTIEDDGNVSDVIKTTYNTWTTYLEQLTEAIKDARKESLKWNESWAIIAAGLVGLAPFLNTSGFSEEADELKTRNDLIDDWVRLVQGSLAEQGKYVKYEDLKAKAVKINNIGLKQQIKWMTDLKQKNIELLEAEENTVAWYEIKIKSAKEELDTKITLGEANSEEAVQLRENIKLWEAAIDKIRGTGKATKRERAHALGELKLYSNSLEALADKQIEIAEYMVKTARDLETRNMWLVLLAGAKAYRKELDKFDQSFDPEGEGLPSPIAPPQGSYSFADKLEIYEEEIDLAVQFANQSMELTKMVYEYQLEQIRAEIVATEEKYDRLYELAEGDANNQQEILRAKEAEMKRLEAEELKIRQKQAKADKIQALFNAGLNIAVAITSALGKGPWVIALTAALGAATLATIAATPIPQYRMGREGGPAEWAITGDGGVSEVVAGKHGVYKTPNVPTLTYLEKGDSVYRNENAYKEMERRNAYKNIDNRGNNFEKAVERGLKKAKINNYVKLPKITVNVDHAMWMAKNRRF